jgi:hypothetical protein
LLLLLLLMMLLVASHMIGTCDQLLIISWGLYPSKAGGIYTKREVNKTHPKAAWDSSRPMGNYSIFVQDGSGYIIHLRLLCAYQRISKTFQHYLVFLWFSYVLINIMLWAPCQGRYDVTDLLKIIRLSSNTVCRGGVAKARLFQGFQLGRHRWRSAEWANW